MRKSAACHGHLFNVDKIKELIKAKVFGPIYSYEHGTSS